MRALVWLHMVWIKAIRFGASHTNLRQPHNLVRAKFKEQTSSSIQVNMVSSVLLRACRLHLLSVEHKGMCSIKLLNFI
jgi:hypothetical protein